MARYSRLESVEERRNMKRAITFGGLTIVAVALLFIYGIPAIGQFAAFVSDLGKGGGTVITEDKTPPAPPKFSNFPDFTNKEKLDLLGTAESGSTIKLTFNNTEVENLTDRDGHFTFNVTLNQGENEFWATATDPSGNLSQKTDEFRITFDNKPPDLRIESPQNGAQFFGAKQRQVTIQGSTEQNEQITINDRIIAVDDDGKFQYTTTLNEGENKFSIKSTDKAGNITESELVLTFSL